MIPEPFDEEAESSKSAVADELEWGFGDGAAGYGRRKRST
jgi:hypothetical protein